jgi:hypothetical protein
MLKIRHKVYYNTIYNRCCGERQHKHKGDFIMDTEHMTWEKIPQEIRDWLCDDTDWIEFLERYDQPELMMDGGDDDA